MRRKKTPSEKKQLSYIKGRRNTYGEGNKTSRKALARRKRVPGRANRHTVRQTLGAARELQGRRNLNK